MANDTEKRIVEMQFDNKDFDKNIRKSQKTLEDFKKSLNFDDAATQMKSFADSTDPANNVIQNMAKNVEKLAKEFAGIGSISAYVAQKIKKTWQDALGSVERFTKSLTTDQISEGSNKYNKVLKSVQTIKNATGEAEEVVYSVMDRLNKYTDETSYNFADMADNIGKFTTAGINLDDAEKEMEGIANWAALAGQGTTEAGRAMYNISQAMSAGYMQKIDYKSIQNAAMDIRAFRQEALDAAVAAGTLKKSKDGIYKTVKGGKTVNLDNFVETLQYKWFDKKTMETVFKTFADNTKGIGETAYKAAQRCTTFTDALGAWKDMLSTGWMKSYELVFGKLSDAMNLFSGLCNKVSESLSKFVEIRNGILEQWSSGSGRNSLWGALVGQIETPDGDTLFEGAFGLLDAITTIGDAIEEAIWDFVGRFVDPLNKGLFEQDKTKYGMEFLGSQLANLTEKFRNFIGGLKDFFFATKDGETESRFDRIKHIAESVFSVIMLIVNVVKGIGQFAGELFTQLSPAFYVVEQLIDMLLQLFTGAVVDGAKKNSIGGFFHSLAETLRPVTTVINQAVLAIGKLIARFALFAKQSGLFDAIGKGIQWVISKISEGFAFVAKSGIFEKIVGWIQNAIAKIPKLIEKIKQFGETAVTAVKSNEKLRGLWNSIKIIFSGKSIKDVLNGIKNWISGLLKQIQTITSGLGGSISGFFETLFGGFLNLFVGSAKADETSAEIASAVTAPITQLGKGSTIADAAIKAVEDAKPGILAKLKEKIQDAWKSVSDFFSSLANSDAIKSVQKFFDGTTFTDILTKFRDIMKWIAIFRGGSGLVSMGKGLKSIGKAGKVFSKNMKDLNLSNIFSGMFNLTNIVNSNNSKVDNSKHFDFGKVGAQLLQIAAAIGIIALAAIELSKLDVESLKKAGISIGVILAALLGASAIAKKFAGNGTSLIGLAAAMWLIIRPMKTLMEIPWQTNSITHKGGLLEMVAKLSLVMGAVVVAARLAGKAKPGGLIKMAVALQLILIPLKLLQGFGNFRNMDGSLTSFSKALLALGGLMLTMGITAGLAGGNKLKGMLSLAVALNLLMIPINNLSKMKTKEIIKGVGPIVLLVGELGIILKLTDKVQPAKFAGLVLAITALATVGWLIGHTMDWKQALVGFVPILGMLGFMALLLRETSKLSVEQISALKTIFVAFAVTIGIIAGSLVALSILEVKESTMVTFFGGLIFTLASIGIVVKLASKTDAKGIGKVALVLGLTAVLIGVAAGGLILLAKENVDWSTIASFMVGIAAIIGVIGIVLPILGKMNATAIVAGCAALAAAVVAIMGAIALMVPVVMGAVGSAMSNMAARLKTMSGLLKDFFDRMDSINETSLDHAEAIFTSLFDIISRFAGFGTYESDMRAVLSSLNYIGAGLDALFVNDSKYPNPESAKTFKILDKLIEVVPMLNGFSVGDIPEQLTYLGVGLMLFNEATKDITTAEPLALTLLKGIFGQSGEIERFAALPLNDFIGMLTALGGAMSLYAKGAAEVTGLDAGEVPDVSGSIGVLKAICESISGEDGSNPFTIPENMPDSSSLGIFAGQLESLASALSRFATAAKSMETDTGKAMELLKFLGEIGGYVTPDNLSVVKAFDGIGHADENGGGPLGQFALDIGALGTALATFADNVGGKDTAFSTGLGVLDHLSALKEKLTAGNLLVAKVFDNAGVHKSTLDTFATDIGALGHALATFAANVTLDDGAKADFTYALGSLDFLTNLQTRMPEIGGLSALINGNKKSLESLGNDVQQLGQSLADFSEKMTTGVNGGRFDPEPVNEVLLSVERLIGVMNSLNMLDPNTGNFVDAGSRIFAVLDFLRVLNNEDVGSLNGFDGSIADELVKFAQGVSTAFAEAEGIDAASIAMFQQLTSSLNNLTSINPNLNFSHLGEPISLGMSEGIRLHQAEINQSVLDVIKAAADNIANHPEIQPKIVPVFDMTDLTGTGGTLATWSANLTLDLQTAVENAIRATIPSGPAEVVVQNPTNLSTIETSLVTLQSEISGLQSAISNIRIVLNTGTIAGEMASGIDEALNRSALYASRRN